jgi:hypothetical protein
MGECLKSTARDMNESQGDGEERNSEGISHNGWEEENDRRGGRYINRTELLISMRRER